MNIKLVSSKDTFASDNCVFNNSIYQRKVITILKDGAYILGMEIENVSDSENLSVCNNKIESLWRTILEDDLSLLEAFLPLTTSVISSIFNEVLSEMKESRQIMDYQIYVNYGREKTGVPRHECIMDNIFLHTNGCYEIYNENHSLLGQIEAIENGVPIINVYYIPHSSNEQDVIELGNLIMDDAANRFGSQYTLQIEVFSDESEQEVCK